MHHDHHDTVSHEPDPADSRADAFAAFALIIIAVLAVVYFVAG